MLQNATLSGNQRPDLLTALMNMSLVLHLPRKMRLCRSSSNAPCLPSFLEMLQNPHILLTLDEVHNPVRLPRETTSEPSKWSGHVVLFACWLRNVLRATTACTFSTSQLPKVVGGWCVFCATTACNFSSLICPAGSARAALASLLFDPPEPQIIGKT